MIDSLKNQQGKIKNSLNQMKEYDSSGATASSTSPVSLALLMQAKEVSNQAGEGVSSKRQCREVPESTKMTLKLELFFWKKWESAFYEEAPHAESFKRSLG